MGEILKIEKSLIAIKRVNQCQLFLQVTWLFEMTDAQGNIVLLGFLEYTSTHTNTSKVIFTGQSKHSHHQHHGKSGKN
jgi:hypothetical protein